MGDPVKKEELLGLLAGISIRKLSVLAGGDTLVYKVDGHWPLPGMGQFDDGVVIKQISELSQPAQQIPGLGALMAQMQAAGGAPPQLGGEDGQGEGRPYYEVIGFPNPKQPEKYHSKNGKGVRAVIGPDLVGMCIVEYLEDADAAFDMVKEARKQEHEDAAKMAAEQKAADEEAASSAP